MRCSCSSSSGDACGAETQGRGPSEVHARLYYFFGAAETVHGPVLGSNNEFNSFSPGVIRILWGSAFGRGGRDPSCLWVLSPAP